MATQLKNYRKSFSILKLSRLSILLIFWVGLSGCQPEQIASVSFETADEKRTLFSYKPKSKLFSGWQKQLVTSVFCRWAPRQFGRGAKFGTKDGLAAILLHCYFDIDQNKNRSSPTRLTLHVGWTRISRKTYKIALVRVSTNLDQWIVKTKRNKCSSNECKIEFDHLELPNLKNQSLKFDFHLEADVMNRANKTLFRTKFKFQGEAPYFDAIEDL